jgi:hypothetical protein
MTSLSVSRLQSMNKPAEAEAEEPAATSRERAGSTLTRKPRVTSAKGKARGKKAAKQGETEKTVTEEGEKEVKDEKEETEANVGKKRGATEGGPETEGEERPKKKGRSGPRGPRRKEVGVVYKEGALNEISGYFAFIKRGG